MRAVTPLNRFANIFTLHLVFCTRETTRNRFQFSRSRANQQNEFWIGFMNWFRPNQGCNETHPPWQRLCPSTDTVAVAWLVVCPSCQFANCAAWYANRPGNCKSCWSILFHNMKINNNYYYQNHLCMTVTFPRLRGQGPNACLSSFFTQFAYVCEHLANFILQKMQVQIGHPICKLAGQSMTGHWDSQIGRNILLVNSLFQILVLAWSALSSYHFWHRVIFIHQ